MAVPSDGHRRCTSQGVCSCGGGRWAAAVLCPVDGCSAALSVLENCSRNFCEGSSGESKNWPRKMSGEPYTAWAVVVFSSSLAACEAEQDPW
jgi:hypothetical protein